jgi:hypothetical protein
MINFGQGFQTYLASQFLRAPLNAKVYLGLIKVTIVLASLMDNPLYLTKLIHRHQFSRAQSRIFLQPFETRPLESGQSDPMRFHQSNSALKIKSTKTAPKIFKEKNIILSLPYLTHCVNTIKLNM